jgi:lauroyl/myristoyl acyltransferase
MYPIRLASIPAHLLRGGRRLLLYGQKAIKGVRAPDVLEPMKLTIQGALAWTLPQRAWWPVARVLGKLDVVMHPERTRKETAQVAALITGTEVERSATRIIVENWGNEWGERFQYLRAWRPGGWSPEIDIIGATHVSAALQRGCGIVFLGGLFSFNNLVPKMAMHRLGLAPISFSVPLHGVSKTAFGIRYLNWIYRDIERLYVGERLMVERAEFAAAMQRMRDYLKDSGTVYFSVGGRGRRTATARFLGGRIIVATGPLAMAYTTGAAVLPLYTRRVGPSRYEVTVGAPIQIPKAADGKPDYEAAVQNFADALTPHVLRDPGQWRGWRLIGTRCPW